jgi:hypothetical protein
MAPVGRDREGRFGEVESTASVSEPGKVVRRADGISGAGPIPRIASGVMGATEPATNSACPTSNVMAEANNARWPR